MTPGKQQYSYLTSCLLVLQALAALELGKGFTERPSGAGAGVRSGTGEGRERGGSGAEGAPSTEWFGGSTSERPRRVGY